MTAALDQARAVRLDAIAARTQSRFVGTAPVSPPPIRGGLSIGAPEVARPLLDPAIAAQAHARLEAERARLKRAAEPRPKATGLAGPGWRPTPTPNEANYRAQSGSVPSPKVWDRSPVDPSSFDSTQPPNPDPPTNTVPPSITVLDSLAVGDQLVASAGSWTGGSLVYARSWLRGSTPIPGATSGTYTMAVEDIGAMIGHSVVAPNAVGSASASAAEVGPVVPAGARRRPQGGPRGGRFASAGPGTPG
jgi:hypothetical protein